MSSLRSTISTFSGIDTEPRAWRNQTTKGDNDALFKSRAQDPILINEQPTNYNQTSAEHRFKHTSDHTNDRKNEGMNYNTIMEKVDKKQKLINELN